MGDSLTCCGVGDMFNVNKSNLNYYLFDKKNCKLTEGQKKNKLGVSMGIIYGTFSTKSVSFVQNRTYSEIFEIVKNDKNKLSAYK